MSLWWSILGSSAAALVLIALRSAKVRAWIGQLLLNMVFAAIFIYFFNILEIVEGLRIPINFITMAFVAWAGIPGILTILALKWWVVP